MTANVLDGLIVISRTRPMNITELFEYAHASFRAAPDSDDAPISNKQHFSGVHAADWDDAMSGSSTAQLLNVAFNYDEATGRAIQQRVPLTTAFAEAYCENCFASVNVGVKYSLVREFNSLSSILRFMYSQLNIAHQGH